MKKSILLALAALLLAGSGCAAVVGASLDAALETKEERHIRKDRERARKGEPMRHHQGWEDLDAHANDLERRRANN